MTEQACLAARAAGDSSGLVDPSICGLVLVSLYLCCHNHTLCGPNIGRRRDTLCVDTDAAKAVAQPSQGPTFCCCAHTHTRGLLQAGACAFCTSSGLLGSCLLQLVDRPPCVGCSVLAPARTDINMYARTALSCGCSRGVKSWSCVVILESPMRHLSARHAKVTAA